MYKKIGLFRYLLPAIAVACGLIGWSSPSNAFINKIVVDSTAIVNYSPIPLGSSTPGPAVSYTVYQGRVFGTLSPTDSHNSIITDITLAAPVSGGNSYISTFQIVTPTNPASRNGLMIHEVPNRGGNAIPTTALIAGVTYVQSGWQGDLLTQCATVSPVPLYPCTDLNTGAYGTLNTTTGAFTAPSLGSPAATLAAYVIQVPVATTDGTAPNGSNTITGQVYGHICTGAGGCGLAVGSAATGTSLMQIQAAAFVPYQPAGYNPSSPASSLLASQTTTNPQFWSNTSQTLAGVNGTITPISTANWTWANCPQPTGAPGTPNPYYVCLANGTFNPNLLYEMSFTAQNPLVLGVGFAAFRDLGSFLRYGTTAPNGGTNPLAGTVTKGMTVGGSQSAAFIHGLIFYGFNQDESNRIVFDGAWPQVDGRMMVMNIRWGQPNNLMYLYMGGDEAPVWWADYPNLARNLPADGMQHRCAQTSTCPQVLETFGSAEIYSEKFSASLCGFTCVADIPLPSNVYRYYSPGATHGGGTLSFNWQAPGTVTVPAGQVAPNSPVPLAYTNNALQASFINLLMNGAPMPPSIAGVTYPSLAAGQLVPNTQAAEGFPNIPGVTYAGNQEWVPFVYNFGPNENYDQESGVPTIQPPTITQVLPGIGVKVDADGNEVAGNVPSILAQAPLATYVGWNLQTTGWYGPGNNSPVGQVFAGAGNSGAYYPFWDTKANRMTAGDPRLSLEERYGTHAGYNCVVVQAVNKALGQRFLLQSDATTLISMASASNVLASLTPTVADTSIANTKCQFTTTHDFNGNAKSDILWRDTAGDVGIWQMNSTTVTSTATIATVPNTWTVVGQRDFNGDGSADILWRDTSGNVGIWLMNGTTVTSTAVVGNAPTSWTIVGTGDFDGDGKGDLLWRDTSGNVGVWLMNGTTPSSTATLGNVPTSWTIAGTGDFNGDGKTDILWRDTSGNVGIWLMNGTTVTSTRGCRQCADQLDDCRNRRLQR